MHSGDEPPPSWCAPNVAIVDALVGTSARTAWTLCTKLCQLNTTWRGLIKRWHGLVRTCDLRGLISDQAVLFVAGNCPHMEVITLSRRTAISDHEQAADFCPDLQLENIEACGAIGDETVRRLAAGCVRLRSVDLSSCKALGDTAIRAIARSCPSLTCVDLSYCTSLTDASLLSLAEGASSRAEEGGEGSSITTLDLTACNFSEAALLRAFSCFPRLEDLHVSLCVQMSDAAVELLGRECGRLRLFDCFGCPRLTDAAIDVILRRCDRLRVLHLSECPLLTNASLGAVRPEG